MKVKRTPSLHFFVIGFSGTRDTLNVPNGKRCPVFICLEQTFTAMNLIHPITEIYGSR